MLTAGVTAHAQAAGIVNLGQATRTAAGGAGGGGGAGVTNLGVSPQQALQASQPSIVNLGHAAQAIAAQITAQQSAAAAAAATASNVPNGLAPGGLQVAPGVTFVNDNNGNPVSQNTDTKNPVLWLNAYGPQQSVDSNGHVTVDITQTGQNAVLTWQTMNVGKQTTLNFDQSAGTQTNGANNWTVLNRINDPSGRPSQILGNMTAQGAVYVINRNGILFGAGSQVNVHSLVASSLDLLNMNNKPVQSGSDIALSNQQFLSGLASPESSNWMGTGNANTNAPNVLLGLGNQASVSSSNSYPMPGDVTIEQGASITTRANGTASDGGFVLIAAPNVSNAGHITATAGQVVLAAGVGVSLKPNPTSPQVLLPELSGQLVTGSGLQQKDVTPAGTLTNTGLVEADRGNINLLGSTVAQNGVVGVTTSVNTPGTITISTVDEYLSNNPLGNSYTAGGTQVQFSAGGNGGAAATPYRAGLLSFGPNSVTAVMPDADGQTVTSSPGTTFTAGSISMTGGSVWFQGGSLIEAPGSKVSVVALTPANLTSGIPLFPSQPPGDTAVPGRIYLDSGATIDVSGLANIELPIAQTLITIPRIGQNELADSPLLRNGFLYGLKNVVVDSTLSGTRSDGVQWVGSPILNLSGYVNLIPRTVDQLLTNGGTIVLSGDQVMTAAGSFMNLNGGYVHYLGGTVSTTRLVDANGAIVPIGSASPYDTYVGIAGAFTETHPRWGVTKTWYNPLEAGGVYEPDYIVGGNAGTLDLFATSALVLDGDISAQAFAGSKQVQNNSQPTGGTFNLGTDPAANQLLFTAGNLAGLTQGVNTNTGGESGLVILQDDAPQLTSLSSAFSIDTPLNTVALGGLSSTDPNNVLATTVVPASTLNAGGFAALNVTEDTNGGRGFVVASGTQLKLQPGGTIKFGGTLSSALVEGTLIVPSGAISISAGGDITVGPNALISTAGQWVNNDLRSAAGTTPGGSEYINGGSVTLSATGSIDLQPGSVIDVSGGGELQANGQLLMSNGIPAGKGGSVSLITYANQTGFPAVLPTDDHLKMDGTIRSFGFAGGGTLTVQAPGFQIGGDPAAAPAWALTLPTDFFAHQGFGKYVLNALFDASVAPGAVVDVTQQNLIPNVPALQQAASGADLLSSGLTTVGTLDAYHRQATNFVMTGGGYLAWQTADQNGINQPIRAYDGVTGGVSIGQGASILGDAGASIGLGSPTQVTVLGSLVAPGGSITLSADSLNAGPFEQSGQYQSTGSNGITSTSKSVWLGPDAVLDVSGVALTNPLAAPVKNGLTTITPNTGKVLPGGSVTISDDSGYVVAQAGSLINVSGTATKFDQLQANGGYASQPVWSDAGSITLAASSGLYFDGTLKAQAGAAQAQGGTLAILPEAYTVSAFEVGGASVSLPGATALIIQQSGNLVPMGLSPGQDIVGLVGNPPKATSTSPTVYQPKGVLQFAADRLAGSGITTLELANQNALNVSRVGMVPIAFAGHVDLTLGRAVIVNAGQIAALGSGQLSDLLPSVDFVTGQPQAAKQTISSLLSSESTATQTGTDVTIDAPYVAFVGPTVDTGYATTVMSPVQAQGDGTLNVKASFIDLKNQIQLNNFGQATFTSSGDIRLSSTNLGQVAGRALEPGELFTPGNLTFKAADLYPATGSTFILDAAGPSPTTITFATNGASGVPLSAGGTLLVDATDIVQGGTVRAPSGTLVFGVGDPTASATQSQFNNLTLVPTESVTFASGSLTSVSNDGRIIPYGTTVDGVEWQFNPVAGNTRADLTAPPAKFISANGSSVALNAGATIDLSGGGNLQAEEWVAGTGGTRDVLSQYNVSYASNATGTAVPVNVGATNVYAILPGAQSPVAAYDPVFAQTVQPTTNANGTVGSTTLAAGVGQASLTSAVGQAVYLSGVPGLAPGYYTLLPGKYATLPGAYRVTVSSSTGNLAPGSSKVLPDGTVVTAGYFSDALTGSRSATPTLFNVQSGQVWQQYSQYALTSANSFFPALAASKGNVTPPLPIDGGQLVLAATKALALGAALNTAADVGGAPAEVDIASQDIEITGNGGAALPGYLQIGADALNSLNAGSLLIGGTRTATTGGVTINPIANSVVVANDAGNALSGPEVLLVTKTDTSGTDPNAVNGLQIDAGSTITANGNYPAAKDQPIAIAGDGALLRVSNGAMTTVTRTGTTGTGLLTVGAGAMLTGGQALTLDSSGSLKVDPAAVLSANAITVDGSAITFTNETGPAAASLPGFVLNPAGMAQLANAQQVILRSAGSINFVGDVDATFGNSVDLSAGSFVSNGGNVALNAQQIAFTNETGTPQGTPTTGSGTLTVNAKEIDFGTGDKIVSGFGSVSMSATGGIVGQNTGTFNFGALPVTLSAPVFLADTGSASTVQTSGTLTLGSAAGTALTRTPMGGAWSLIGGTVNDNGATVAAPAGNVSVEATTGNLTVGNGATINSAGVAKQFFDVTEYAPAGAIALTADTGTVDVQPGSTLDFSGASGGGAAGSLALSAPQQVVNLNGVVNGGAANGYAGGSFSLDTGGAANLDSLAQTLASSGVNQAIAIQTKAGNLTLSAGNMLTAHSVSLIADGGAGKQVDTTDGNITILGTINASGTAGGTIQLYGKSSVDVEGTLRAIATTDGGNTVNTAQRGGAVEIGTSAVFDPSFVDPVSGTAYNATYGYESISAATSPGPNAKYLFTGAITIGPQANIDVRGGTAGGLSGGKVSLRAPLLSNGQVPVSIDSGAQINGSRSTTVEAYAVWSTTDATTGAQHFDGIVDPAGWYDSKGHLLAGTFTAQGTSGTTFSFTPDGNGGGTLTNNATGAQAVLTGSPQDQAQLSTGVASIGFGGFDNSYFTPTTSNTNHQTFYGGQIAANSDGTATVTPGTLMNFVKNGLSTNPSLGMSFPGSASLRVAPGIELDNPSTSIINNSGNISILTNWNLGAGAPNSSGSITPAFRYLGTIAPTITLRAAGNVIADASITDGFFQNQVATILGGQAPAGGGSNTYASDLAAYASALSQDGAAVTVTYFDGSTQALTSADPLSTLSAPLSGQSSVYYDDYAQYLAAWEQYYSDVSSSKFAGHLYPNKPLANPTAVPVLTSSNAADYYGTASAPGLYLNWLNSLSTTNAATFGTPPALAFPTGITALYPSYITAYSGYLVKATNYNSRSKTSRAWNFFWAPQAPEQIAALGNSIGILPGNMPANVPTANNPLPIAFASLAGGESSSYRIVAGADLTSANPLGLQAASLFSSAGSASSSSGNIMLDGHTAYIDSNGLTLLQPTAIRTGTGSIDIAAGNDVEFLDHAAPAVIYTGGAPAAGAPQGSTATIVAANVSKAFVDTLVTASVNPDSAGDITIHAQGDISGIEDVIDSTGAISVRANQNISQFWSPWMEIGNPTGSVGATKPATQTVRTSVDFGAFDQGVMSVGGNVSVTAGGNITDLAVSLPTTWYLTNANTDNPTVNTIGGGNLSVHAGGNILSGDYFIAKGTGTITAGGLIGTDGVNYTTYNPSAGALGQGPTLSLGSVGTLLAAQDGVLNVSARQGANIGGVLDPSYAAANGDQQGYSSTSAVNVQSVTGSIDFGTLGTANSATRLVSANSILPASLNLTAFTGGITLDSASTLYPSATGQLNLIADQTIEFSNVANGSTTFGMSDADPSSMPSPAKPKQTPDVHASNALHAGDTTPARIYSLNGSIVDGILEPAGAQKDGLYDKLVTVAVDKPALIQAGQDIVNLAFQGQNLRAADVTRIVAGRDIFDTPYAGGAVPSLVLGGPGTFDVEAGRNIGPLTSQAQVYAALKTGYVPGTLTGIDAIGNANNTNLPHESANVQVLFGVGPGINDAAFISAYIDPSSTVRGVPSTTPALIAFMEQYDAGQAIDTGLNKDKQAAQQKVGTLSAGEAWKEFQALPPYVQQLFAEQVLFSVLTQVGEDYNNQSSPYHDQYARGYQAINALFPASLGYTANNLGGGTNGANKLINTGNLDMRSTTIQTQEGGNISILGPGGQALVGSTSAPPEIVNGAGQVVAGPGTQGILTLEQGDINIFTDQSVLLAQSRIFTEQGGAMTIWSSNGDINAGKGSKSVADTPEPQYVCDVNHYCTVDARGDVTGAGIATLQTIPGAPASNANLIAPRGTVDAGDAGIRVSGNLNVAALHVANVDNIQVQGKSTGIPVAQAVNTGALTAADSAASAASQMAQDIVKNSASGIGQRRWTISVQVEGFGDSADDGFRKKSRSGPTAYDSSSAVSILGFGAIGQKQQSVLSEEEQRRLGKI
nr:filamentous haemagglutinin family protein [Trinickia symbiotica]